MRPLVLSNEYELTIDDKSRLLIPSDVRKEVDPVDHGEAFFLITGVNRKLWFYPEKYYEQLVARTTTLEMIPNPDQLAYDQLTFAMASRVAWDKQGRLLIPERTLRRSGLGKEVTLIGVGNHLELWNRAEWDEHREALWRRSAEIATRAKQARSTP